MTIKKLDPVTGLLVESVQRAFGKKRQPKRCKACDRARGLCGVLVGGYCADCRQLPLPFRRAAELVTEAKQHTREAARALEPREVGAPRRRPPAMMDLGWSCNLKGTELWQHRTGALVEFRGSFPMGTRAARLNGGPWEPIEEMFYVTIDRALQQWRARA